MGISSEKTSYEITFSLFVDRKNLMIQIAMMRCSSLFVLAVGACFGSFFLVPLSAISLSGLKLPPLTDFCPQCDISQTFQSSGCNVSRVPVDPKFTVEAITGNWYNVMGTRNELTAISTLPTVSDLRSTIVEGDFGDTIRVYMCAHHSLLGGLGYDRCPSSEYELLISEGNVLKPEVPPVILPLTGLMPRLAIDKIQQRVIAVDAELMVTYSCLIPLADGSCTTAGLFLGVMSRTKQLSPAALERVKAIVQSTCIKFEDLETYAQTGSYPFYVPT